jgi:tRNA/tmRNA/rRNA uracil-C5-methylase (TrmA/RlmC/RlmD family)
MTLAANPACNPACQVCHYKELPYSEQLARKQAWAEGQFARWRSVLRPIRPAPLDDQVAYRSKSWLRAHVLNSGKLSFGMFRAERQGERWGKEFVSWDTCPLHVPAIQRMIERLRAELPRIAPIFVRDSLLGVWMGQPHLVVVARGDREENLRVLREIDWSRVLEPPFDRAWFHRASQVGKTVFQHREVHLLAGPEGQEHPIRAFRQIARTLLREARAEAVDWLLAPRPAQLVDLYCGTGELSRQLPPHVAWLGIELSMDAINAARGARPGVAADNHLAFAGTVEQRLADPRVLEAIRASYSLYLNPPRPGLGEEGRAAIARLLRERRPESIAYLSCSASSLARDLPALEAAGFDVMRLQPYDFFPQTEHFETLALLTSSGPRK